jgi:hypothetical protein
MLNNIYNYFDQQTNNRLSIINPIDIPYKSYILDYLNNLPQVKLIKPNFITKTEKAPLKALIESRFARYDNILNSVKKLEQKYVLDLDPHKIIIYGTDVSKEYINHVASIIRWWEKIKPQTYEITFYLTDIKKILPPDNLPKVITEEFGNSGFTFVREPSDIHIFRKEESLKVLIHELIHASKFDFNGSNIIDIPCNIKDDDISNEGITEYLAIIHYYWYVASYICDFSDKSIINIIFTDLLSHDMGWQDYQVNKILNYFDLDADDLLAKNNFKQKTSILSYFFLKNYLFTQNSLPIILSRDINKINGLIRGMKQYLINHEKSSVLEQSISLRMSLYELDY